MKKSFIIEICLFVIFVCTIGFLGGKFIKHTFDIGTTYHLVFKDIYGIEIGSPVRILGVDIGHVTKIQNNYNEIYVDFVVPNSNIKLPDGTQATIEFFGIAGSRSIELTPPNQKTNAQGILINEPLRLGDAIDIMEKFAEAMMASVSGLYDFAKARTQQQVEQTTANLLKATNEADDKVVNLTATIEKGGAKLHKSFKGTNKGMTRLYDEATRLNAHENINKGRYVINVSKRYLVKLHKNIKTLNKETKDIFATAAFVSQNIENINYQTEIINKLNEAFDSFDNAMIDLNNNLTQENLDKAYDKIEEIKLQSENIKNSI